MKFSEHNWLISYNLLLRFLIFMVGMPACNSVMYIPYTDQLIHGADKVEKECSKKSLMSAKINNSLTLGIAKQALTDNKEYWTGLSWRKTDGKFYWDKKPDQPTSVENELAETPEAKKGWKCFWIKKDQKKLKVADCNIKKHYICEKEEPSNKNGATQEKQTAKKRLKSYIEKIKALNATEKDSLQDAANTTSTFFEDLNNNPGETNDINVLVATQELESFAIKYGNFHYITNESTVISKKNYAMKIRKVPADTKDAVVFSVNETDYSATDGWASISLPPVTFEGKDAVVVLILYNDIKQWVPDEGHVELDGKTFPNLELQSRIIASTVDPKPPGILKENVTISFTFDKETKEEDIPHCVFWDFTIKSQMNGSWSSKGCSLVKIVNKEVTCTCNHLTNFAVLMQVGGNKEVPSAAHRKALEVITYVGCALSLTGEALTIIAYCVLM